MKELDLLKKDWQRNDQSFQQVTDNEIHNMIHKNSSSIVKWIFIISVLEIILWSGISLFFNTDEEMKKMNNESAYIFVKALTYFNYAVVLIFIYLFYKNYSTISTLTSTKQLMRDILKTRKTVQFYVWYNLGMFLFCTVLGMVFALTLDPKVNSIRDKITNNTAVLLITIGVMIVICLILFGAFWLFYRLLYGILLRKLNANYKELEKMDQLD